MDNQFYVYLPSDSSITHFPENTVSSFRTYLPQTLNLSGKNWYVALHSIVYSTDINFDSNSNIKDEIFVYTNFVKPSIVGDSFQSILSVFKYNKKGIFEPALVYHPVIYDYLQTINITIRNQLGQPIKFKSGRVIITLQFKAEL
jgi:hypothetical protein